jgi:CHAT domain-containing protein
MLDPLTVSRLSQIWSKNQAHLIYLSACSTAGTLNQRLANQVVHIASEFLLIGFPHVIGAIWKSQDDACLRVAIKFYEVLAEQYDDGLGKLAVAEAFHDAVKELRTSDPDNFLAWLPFVHYGA